MQTKFGLSNEKHPGSFEKRGFRIIQRTRAPFRFSVPNSKLLDLKFALAIQSHLVRSSGSNKR